MEKVLSKMKLINPCSQKFRLRALPLLLMLYGVLPSLTSSLLIPGLPHTVPRGSLFTLAHAFWLQSENGQFQLDLRSWPDSGVTRCMGGIRYTHRTPNALIWSFNVVPEPWSGTNCTLEFRSDGVLAFALNVNDSSPPVVVWQTPASDRRAENLTLQDDGNLVLLDEEGAMVWQSFGFFHDVLIIPSGMKFFRNNTLDQRVSVYSDFSVAGCYAASLSPQGKIMLFTRANLFVYHTISLNGSTERAPSYAVIEQDIEFYDDESNLLGVVPHNIVDSEALAENRTDVVFSALFQGSNFMIDRSSLSDPGDYSWHYNSSVSKYCDNPLVCGEYALCDEATRECSCPAGFKNAVKQPICDGNLDEATQKCSCPEKFQMSKFNSTCIADDPSYSLTPISVSFHPQPSAFTVGSQDECRVLCARNASCTASLFDSNSSSCALFPIMYTIARPSQDTPSGQVMFLKITSSEKQSNSKVLIIVALTSAAALALVCFVVWRWWSNKIRVQKQKEQFLQELSKLPQRYSYKDLQVATKNFSKTLGVGAFGSVFEGTLITPSGPVKVAVKRLEKIDDEWDNQFRAEIATIGSVSHVNLVSLKGFCMEKDIRLLVLEFMIRGSLDKWLYAHWDHGNIDVDKEEITESSSHMLIQNMPSHKPPTNVLDWEKRCQIALDTAKALEYLHHHAAEHIVHCDVKPSNILLDENFHAKVADFGLAKLMASGTQSFTMTTMKGTRGYLAPEWLQERTITAKSDVFSYGVVLLELLSGRRCLDSEHGYLPIWAMKIVAGTQRKAATTSSLGASRDSALIISPDDASILQSTMMDKCLYDSDVPPDSFVHMLKLALACVQADPVDRPKMTSVVQILEGVTDVPYSLQSLNFSLSSHHRSPVAAKDYDFSTSHSGLSLSVVVCGDGESILEGR